MPRWGSWNKGLSKYPVDAEGKRPCVKCGERKPLEEFKKNYSCVYGRDTICRLCHNKVSKAYYSTQEGSIKLIAWRRARAVKPETKLINRASTLRRHHNMSLDDYRAMKQAQNGLCAICGRPPGAKDLAVDHDHVTGRRRALLCGPCNKGLGQFRDNPELVLKAALYLLRYNAPAAVSEGA